MVKNRKIKDMPLCIEQGREAIRENRKTQFRMPMIPQPFCPRARVENRAGSWLVEPQYANPTDGNGITDKVYREPLYKIGDVLVMLEPWRMGAWDAGSGDVHRQHIAVDYHDDMYVRKEWIQLKDYLLFDRLMRESCNDADEAEIEISAEGKYLWEPGESPCRWRESLEMPREAARVVRKITEVKAERLHAITPADLFLEGCPQSVGGPDGDIQRAFFWYRDVWNSTFGADTWKRNYLVWVFTFEETAIANDR